MDFERTCTECNKKFKYSQHGNETISEREKMLLVMKGASPQEFTNTIKIRCPHCKTAALIQAPSGFWISS